MIIAALTLAASIRWTFASGVGSSWLPNAQVAAACVLVAGLSGLMWAWVARRPSLPGVELRVPVVGARWYVVQGGGSWLTNQHASVPAQRYALDLTVVDDDGRRAAALSPASLSGHRAWGVQVVAPCGGLVVAAQGDRADLPLGTRDTGQPAGNFVAIQCDDAVVLLAHLQQGSLAVSTGSAVTGGQPLGRIGNSGNTSEPHLHAVRGPFTDMDALLFGGEGRPLTLDGAWLVRGKFGPR